MESKSSSGAGDGDRDGQPPKLSETASARRHRRDRGGCTVHESDTTYLPYPTFVERRRAAHLKRAAEEEAKLVAAKKKKVEMEASAVSGGLDLN